VAPTLIDASAFRRPARTVTSPLFLYSEPIYQARGSLHLSLQSFEVFYCVAAVSMSDRVPNEKMRVDVIGSICQAC